MTKTAKNLGMGRDLAQIAAKYIIMRGIKIPANKYLYTSKCT
jgi:hypothetical protein